MKPLFRFFTNKFLVTGVAFIVWMYFFDENNWMLQRERKEELRNTKSNIAYLKNEIAAEEIYLKNLTSNAHTLEKFAREKYRMKRDNEDVYVIERK